VTCSPPPPSSAAATPEVVVDALQRPRARARIGSEQWTSLRRPLVPSTEAGALELGRRYLAEVGHLTARLVRPSRRGECVSLSLLGRVDLISFAQPEARVSGAEVACRLPIVGGALVARPGGSLSIVQCVGPEPQLGLVVAGYIPRLAERRPSSLGVVLYDGFQARLHVWISRRFLARMREAAR
jgi:hypothetical protein